MFKVFIIVLSCLFCSVSAARATLYVPETESQALALGISVDDPLVQAAGLGFAAAIRKENSAWYECGKATPREEFDARGLQIALALRVALLEVGLKDASYLWGLLGIVYHESRGNPCVTGPNSRVWARDNEILGDVHWTRYTEEDIFKIVHSKQFKKKRSGIDSGIAQTLFPRNTLLYDVHSRTVRPATIEEMVTVEGGARAAAYHMLEKAVESPNYPWMFWPGKRDDRYAKVLAFHVRKMGGPYNEIIPSCNKSR